MSVTMVRVGPLGLATPTSPALKKHSPYTYTSQNHLELILEAPTPFKPLPDPGGGFGHETRNGRYVAVSELKLKTVIS
jgi:hypothetical protein